MHLKPQPSISAHHLQALSHWFWLQTGIVMGERKRELVEGRLRRLWGGADAIDFNAQIDGLLQEQNPLQQQLVIDALVTNETRFFREPAHFDFLKQWLSTQSLSTLDVWSAACSSGEEVYSLAMTLASCCVMGSWRILGSDISHKALHKARQGLYAAQQGAGIAQPLYQKYCLEGQGDYQNTILIDRAIRQQVQFSAINLNQPLPPLGPFHVIFLRNMLIYFDDATRAKILQRVLGTLAPNGLLFCGHAESLVGLGLPIQSVANGVYRLKKTQHAQP
jgi:chemotaxis protein methyltransferase CheR